MNKRSPSHKNLIRILLSHPHYLIKKTYGYLEFKFGVESVYELDRIDIVITNALTGKSQRRIMTEVTTLLKIATVVHDYIYQLPLEEQVGIQTILKDITSFITNFEDKHNDIN